MINLKEVLDDQKDLSLLCKDRQLKTNEIFLGNAFYGTDKIIKRYVGLPDDYKLRGVLPHGVSLSKEYIWKAEQDAQLPAIFFYPGYRKSIYKSETNKLSIPIASPFLYLKSLLDNKEPVKRQGTIFFPSHSSHRVTVLANYKALAEKLDSLEKPYHPITVCMYWKDYLLGHHTEFEKKGFNIVSCGHIFDPDFLYRFYYLTRTHEFASSNNIGSHLFYSMSLGCTFFLLEGLRSQHDFIGNSRETDTIDANPISVELYNLFCGEITKNTDKQLSLVDAYMGENNFLSPHQLKKQIKNIEKIDKFGFVFNAFKKSVYISFPRLYFRMATNFFYLVRKTIIKVILRA